MSLLMPAILCSGIRAKYKCIKLHKQTLGDIYSAVNDTVSWSSAGATDSRAKAIFTNIRQTELDYLCAYVRL